MIMNLNSKFLVERFKNNNKFQERQRWGQPKPDRYFEITFETLGPYLTTERGQRAKEEEEKTISLLGNRKKLQR